MRGRVEGRRERGNRRQEEWDGERGGELRDTEGDWEREGVVE